MEIGKSSIQLNFNPIIPSALSVRETQSGGTGRPRSAQEIISMLQSDILQIDGANNEARQYMVEFDETEWQEDYSDDPSGAQKALLAWTVLGSAKSYADRLDAIHNSDLDQTQRSEAIKWLDTSYRSAVGEKIKAISAQFDNYFDQGNQQLQMYSKEALKDLFDSDIFASHMADMALYAKDMYTASDKEVSDSDVIASLNAMFKNSGIPEKMSYSDMDKLLGFINTKRDTLELRNGAKIDLGQSVAENEKEVLNQVRELGLSKNLFERVKMVEKRRSEGFMRNGAYMQESELYENTREKLLEEYNRLLERLSLFERQIETIMDADQITPGNNQLFSILERQKDVQDSLRDIKKSMDENEKNNSKLEKDKSTIVEKESYTRIKASYEATLKQ